MPALPAQWPYADRNWDGALTERPDQGLPGLGGGWTLRIHPECPLDGEESPLPGAFGRGGVFRVGGVVLRPYRRGGMVRHVNRTTYAGIGRFRNEFDVHAGLFTSGFPTVEPLGYGFRRRGLGWQGVFLTRWAEARPWPAEWSATSAILPSLGVAIRALDAVGCWAPDLNATNVLVTSGGGIQLVDWDRAVFGEVGKLIPSYRNRLLRSLQKLGAPSDVVGGISDLLNPA